MKYNRLGQSGLTVSELGLGCQSLGGGLYFRNKRESLAVVHKALDAGVTFFDTSDHYSLGESERWLGEALGSERDNVVLATKAGTRYTQMGRIAGTGRSLLRPFGRYLRPLKIPFHRMRAAQKRQDFSRDYLTRAVEASLVRLETDRIDLFQLHKPSRDVLDDGEWLDTLQRMQRAGKIRHYGVSSATVDDAFCCLGLPGIAAVQVGISLLDQAAIPDFLERAREAAVGVIARNPRAQGYLTMEFHDIMAETYARNREEVEAKMQRAREFSFLRRDNRTLAQSALRFVLQLQGVAAAVPRAVNVAQMTESLGALDAPELDKTEVARALGSFRRHTGGGI